VKPATPRNDNRWLRLARVLSRRRVGIGTLVSMLAGVVLFRLFVVETAIVDGNSMYPTLQTRDRVFVALHSRPKRFDIMVFHDPSDDTVVIKRVIGLPGDTVEIAPRVVGRENGEELFSGNIVLVNGEPLDEPYADGILPTPINRTKLGPEQYFFLGDNRDNSMDSRDYGPVKSSNLQGRAVFIYFPLAHARRVRGAEALPASQARSGSSLWRDERKLVYYYRRARS
jgi:signal peptidase I